MENGRERSHLSELAISSSQYINEEKYWLNKLGGEIVKSHFPYDSRYKREGKPAAGVCRFTLEKGLAARVIKSARDSDPRIHMILTAGLVALLYKYTGNTDIIVGTSIYKQEAEGEFINTVLALRHSLDHGMTFRELLKQVRQTAAEANENANYPLETLLFQLNMPASPDYFPLFDVVLLLENIHDKRYIQGININMVFTFSRTEESIDGEVEYNASLYTPVSVEMVAHRFNFLLETLLGAADSIMRDIELVDEEEKKQLIAGFNDTGRDYPLEKTLVRLFEEQVEKTPGNPVVVNIDGEGLSYGELNERANRLAAFLREKGARPDKIVGVMIAEPLEMAVGLMAVLKAGGAYLPIDPEVPAGRTAAMVEDVHCSLLITQRQVLVKYGDALSGIIAEIIVVDETDLGRHPAENPVNIISCRHLAYVIFTSGSTGSPKGSVVEHRSAVNTLLHRKEEYRLDANVVSLQLFAFTFDGFVTSFFSPIISGSRVVLPAATEILDMNRLKTAIVSHNVTHFICVPALYKIIMENLTPGEAASLKVVTLAGDILSPDIIGLTRAKNPGIEIVNEYGVTEAGVMSTLLRHQESKKEISIGKPVANTAIYILEANSPFRLQPVGIFGELCIAGAGIARGYLNNPQLTAEKFGNYRSYRTYIPGKIYKTGDLARWLADGNIEFLGRMDHQVKIRGFRIELGEIENQLVRLPGVGNAVVIKQDYEGEGRLAAYVVPAAGDFNESGSDRNQFIADLKNRLAARLPDYMVPSVFVLMNELPLTSSGKVDRKALPEPDLTAGMQYIAPRDDTERKMVEVWSEVLGIDREVIGIDANFFQMGGHSLKAIKLVSRIHEVFDVKVPVGHVFDIQTIRGLAEYVENNAGDKFSRIEPAPQKEYYALSPAQKRIYIVQQMDPGNVSYNAPQFIPLPGNIDKDILEDAFRKLIARHESLRTSFENRNEEPVQIIHPVVPFKVDVFDARGDKDNVQKITAGFVKPFDLGKAPILRVGLVNTGEYEALLLVDAHLIICDGESNDILVKDFMALYRGEELPPLRLQYKDYTEWQAGKEQTRAMKAQEEYWLNQFAGEIPVLELPTDYERPEIQGFEGDSLGFRLEDKLKNRLDTLIKETGTTLFMAALAAFNILLSKYSGQEDIIVGSAISGRPHADLENILGMFVNMLSLRNYSYRNKTFSQFLQEVKTNCLGAYENQDYQFDQLVDALGLWRVVDRNPLFNVVLSIFKIDVEIGGADSDGVEQMPYDLKHKDSKFDLRLSVIEARDAILMTLEYKTLLFKTSTIEKMKENYIEILEQVLENRDIKIGDIAISYDMLLVNNKSEEEKVEFNF